MASLLTSAPKTKRQAGLSWRDAGARTLVPAPAALVGLENTQRIENLEALS